MVDNDNGVISVQPKETGTDMSGDLGLGVTNIFVIFNIEDVYGVTGDKYRTGPETNIQSILGKPVDLTARYSYLSSSYMLTPCCQVYCE